MALWEDVDERVLIWVAQEARPSFAGSQLQLNIRPDEPCAELPGLTCREVDDALKRLVSYELVDAIQPRHETSDYAIYFGLRLTALGHRVLGEWPDLEHVTAIEAVRLALQAVAEHAPPEERPLLRRAIGIVGEIGTSIVQTAVAGEAGELGGSLG